MLPDEEGARRLSTIGIKNNCDKFSLHHFERVYAGLFQGKQDQELRLLEIGIGEEGRALGGASLLTWSEFLPNATIIGIDLYDKRELDSDRIITRVCDQGSADDLARVIAELGPFDIVIDDGSHRGHDVATSMFALLGAVRPGGTYVLEDLQTSYWPEYGGSSIAPLAFDTAIRWLKFMVDVVNRSEIPNDLYFPLRAGFAVSALHVYRNIAVLEVEAAQPPPMSSVLDPARKADTLARDLLGNSHRLQLHDLLVSDPAAFGSILDLLSDLGSPTLVADLQRVIARDLR